MAHLKYLVVLTSFAFIISSGIYIFSRGFLLTRVARIEKKNCDNFYVNLNGKYCLTTDKVSKSSHVLM
jgi:GPI ethanolamine phosphate transferase 3 subunit O